MESSSTFLKPKYYLFFIILFSLIIRCYDLSSNGLWFDESISFNIAKLEISKILKNEVRSCHPPLYYLFLHFWIDLFSDNDFTARILSILWNILLIPAVFILSNKLFKSYKVSFFSTFLIAISPFHIEFSKELRMYTQVMFFTTTVAVSYLNAINYSNLKYWSVFLFISLLAIYTHYFSVFFLVGLFFFTIFEEKSKKNIIRITLCGSILFLLYLPWIFLVLGQSDYAEGSFRPLFEQRLSYASIIGPMVNLVFLLFGRITNKYYFFTSFFIVLYLIVFMTIYLLFRCYNSFKIDFSQKFSIYCIFFIFVPPSIFYFIFKMYFPVQSIAIASPFFLIFFCSFIRFNSKVFAFLITITIFVSLAGSFFFLPKIIKNKSFDLEIVKLVKLHYMTDDIILHTDDFSYFPFMRYFNLPNHARLISDDARLLLPEASYSAINGTLWDIKKLENLNGRLWLIVYGKKSSKWQQIQLKYFLANFELIDLHLIGGCSIYLFNLNRN